MAKPTSLPDQALTNAATQAQGHLPTELPPTPTAPPIPPTDLSLPDDASNMSITGVNHLPDWIVIG